MYCTQCTVQYMNPSCEAVSIRNVRCPQSAPQIMQQQGQDGNVTGDVLLAFGSRGEALRAAAECAQRKLLTLGQEIAIDAQLVVPV